MRRPRNAGTKMLTNAVQLWIVPLVVLTGLVAGWLLAGSDEGTHVVSAAERAAIELEAAWPGASGR